MKHILDLICCFKEPIYQLTESVTKITGTQNYPAFELFSGRKKRFPKDRCRREITYKINLWNEAVRHDCNPSQQWGENQDKLDQMCELLEELVFDIIDSNPRYLLAGEFTVTPVNPNSYEKVTAWKLIGVTADFTLIDCNASNCCNWIKYKEDCIKETLEGIPKKGMPKELVNIICPPVPNKKREKKGYGITKN